MVQYINIFLLYYYYIINFHVKAHMSTLQSLLSIHDIIIKTNQISTKNCCLCIIKYLNNILTTLC